jgi:hypothetical protein
VLFIRSVHRVIHFDIYRHRIRTTHQGDVSNGPRTELMAPAPSRCAYQRRVLTNDVCGSGFVRNTSVKLFQGSRATSSSFGRKKTTTNAQVLNNKHQIATSLQANAFCWPPLSAHKPSQHTMAPTTRANTNWAVDRAVSLLDVWALIAAFSGLVGAWRLLGVCRAAREGAKEFLGTLPRLVLCGRISLPSGTVTRETWGLDLATLRWEAMPAMVCARYGHACCAVRGALVVLGGMAPGGGSNQGIALSSRVEMLRKGAGAFVTVMRRRILCSCDRCGRER